MPEAIEITDIRLVEMSADEMTRVMAQSGVSWYRLTLTVRNRSNEPIHLMSDIRRIRYDAGRRVLVMHLSENDAPNENPVVGLPMPPRYRVLGAREETTIVHPLSSPIAFLEISSDGARRPRYVRLTEDVDSVECTVAYETVPPVPVIHLTARTAPDHWRGSGTTVTASWKALPLRKESKRSSE